VLQNNADALQQYRETYKYILVDEAQDLNYVQWQLIKLLGEEHKNVCLVGDDCQNIYSWRGSNHRFMYDFRDTFDAEVYTLPRNYRSTQQIVDAVNRFMEQLDDVEPKELVSDAGRVPQSDGFPQISAYENAHLERNKVVRTIHELVENGQDPDDIGILLRTRGKNGARIDAYQELLSSMRLEHADTRGSGFLNRREVNWILTYLKAYLNPDDDIVIQNLLLQQDGIDSDDIATLQDEQPDDTSFRTYVAELTPLHASIISPDRLRTIQDTLAFITGLDDADNMVQEIYEETGLKQRIVDWGGDTETRRMNVESLKEAMAEYSQSKEGVSAFFDHITNTAAEEASDGITVTTMHGAKGKEWDVVFIPEATANTIPHPMAEDVEEEKRLFYVALSRARERSYVSYHGTPSEFLEYL
jgi:DNA helicase-2/ATP-dependent DNA helicase PcrA